MPNTLWVAPTANFISTTLNGATTNSATTITLTSTVSMQAPGYVVIDRTDSAGTATSSAREVVSYTGISGNDLTGCTRPSDGSTARSHGDGAVVETIPTTGMWNSLTTIVATAFTSDGYLKPIASPASISVLKLITLGVESIASIGRTEVGFTKASSALVSIATILGNLNVSGASITGIPLSPVFIGPGDYSGPTIAIGGLVSAPRATTLSWVAAFTRYVVSTASVAFDIKLRGASIFANATTSPAIAAGGTYVSTSSIATRNVNSADLIQADVLSVGANGFVRQITIQAG